MFEYACEFYSYFNALLIHIVEEGLKFHHKPAVPWDESREDLVKSSDLYIICLYIDTI